MEDLGGLGIFPDPDVCLSVIQVLVFLAKASEVILLWLKVLAVP